MASAVQQTGQIRHDCQVDKAIWLQISYAFFTLQIFSNPVTSRRKQKQHTAAETGWVDRQNLPNISHFGCFELRHGFILLW